ncbi:MAG: porphobilinogen synthase [Candidatus Omnitrophica bacterium CG11_big_fil_rev_8_21_14_0_20_64_10]|nr:MAG: porphobilinogen synthase [Candidatus Omnitrophica bacterium CG11_big_fil_rev_8_21_14_0_20_64_10]
MGFPRIRPRRNRRRGAIRALVRETRLHPADLVLPLFVQEGKQKRTPIRSLPGQARLSIDLIVREARAAHRLGIRAVALFPVIPGKLKDPRATASTDPDGLLPRAIEAVKKAVPQIALITDVAMDPYSSDGHDGLVEKGRILNDPTLEILSQMALTQAASGADYVAPSDMMDGRVAAIRKALDENGFSETGILSYSAKVASAFYGPFREALDSAPKSGDKKSYQMDPANLREAVREARLDEREGADIVMVKPAGPYLDVIRAVREAVRVPVAAYQVSGEYGMLTAAAEKGWLDLNDGIRETLTGIKRAGADILFTYFAKEAARQLQKGGWD